MAFDIKKIFPFLKGKAKQAPENEDVLEAYPLRMQISAIPERRYLRTARLLTVVSFFNMAILMALGGIFVYCVNRLDVSVNNPRVVNLYAMDPENKVIHAAEYEETSVPALQLMMEQGVRNYILSRLSIDLDQQKQLKNWGPNSYLRLYTPNKEFKRFSEQDAPIYMSEAKRMGTNHEVHIYSVRQTPSGLWEALVDVFHMKPRNPYNPVCDCDDNSRECISCKEKNNLGRIRYRVLMRTKYNKEFVNVLNPLGISVLGFYPVPEQVHPNETFWNLPPVLRPEI